MKTHLLILLLIFQNILAFSQFTYVSGTAKGAEGKKIYLKTYTDFISFNEDKLASAVIDTSGYFNMKIKLDKIKYAWFEVDYYVGDVYLEPEVNHNFVLKGIHFTDHTDKINTNLQPMFMDVQVADSANDVLNFSIRKLNIIYNVFLREHLADLHSREIVKDIKNLYVKLDSVFSDNKSSYFISYLKYRLAYLELDCGQYGTSNLILNHLFNKPVLFDNIEYMSLISKIFEIYFTELDRPVSIDILRRTINEDYSYPALCDTLGRDSLLRNEVFREVAMLIALKNLYTIKGFSRNNILEILRQISLQSKFDDHRKAAANLIATLTRFSPGVSAPQFALPDAYGDTVYSEDLLNKPVYINFFTTWNIACLNELDMIKKLHLKYSQSFNFVSICCDREYMTMYHFCRDRQYPWTILHFNSDYDLLNKFGVKKFPFFVLLNTKGEYIKNPAESPSENIEMRFVKMMNDE